MTHDELLTAIKGYEWHQQDYRAWSIVSAIVERHFPSGDCSDPECNPKCAWCNCGFEYPCADIQIVDEHLK